MEALQSLPDSEAQEHRLFQQWDRFHHFMHECRACQQELALPPQVCAHCEARLSTVCPRCRHPLPPAGALACVQCGVEIPAGDGRG